MKHAACKDNNSIVVVVVVIIMVVVVIVVVIIMQITMIGFVAFGRFGFGAFGTRTGTFRHGRSIDYCSTTMDSTAIFATVQTEKCSRSTAPTARRKTRIINVPRIIIVTVLMEQIRTLQGLLLTGLSTKNSNIAVFAGLWSIGDLVLDSHVIFIGSIVDIELDLYKTIKVSVVAVFALKFSFESSYGGRTL